VQACLHVVCLQGALILSVLMNSGQQHAATICKQVRPYACWRVILPPYSRQLFSSKCQRSTRVRACAAVHLLVQLRSCHRQAASEHHRKGAPVERHHRRGVVTTSASRRNRGALDLTLHCGSDPEWNLLHSSDAARVSCIARPSHRSLSDPMLGTACAGLGQEG